MRCDDRHILYNWNQMNSLHRRRFTSRYLAMRWLKLTKKNLVMGEQCAPCECWDKLVLVSRPHHIIYHHVPIHVHCSTPYSGAPITFRLYLIKHQQYWQTIGISHGQFLSCLYTSYNIELLFNRPRTFVLSLSNFGYIDPANDLLQATIVFASSCHFTSELAGTTHRELVFQDKRCFLQWRSSSHLAVFRTP